MNTVRWPESFEFGGFRLDVARRRLLAPDGQPIELPSRAFDLLLYLVQRPGELIDKSQLLRAVWPTTVVEESNLAQYIFVLRRALGDTASEHRFIATVTGRGYQFVAEVRSPAEPEETRPEPAAPPSPGITHTPPAQPPIGGGSRVSWTWFVLAVSILAALAAWLSWSRLHEPGATQVESLARNSIAVLPFTDLSPAGDMEYFADGIAEEIMSSLAKAGFQTIGRRSALAFKGKEVNPTAIGEKLGADTILEGSVRRTDDRIRIAAQLVSTRDGVNVWSHTYDRKLDDILDVQDTIAREVTAALSPILGAGAGEHTSAAHTEIAAAYTAFLLGRHLIRDSSYDSTLRARDEFLKAVELDPNFALAHAWLALTYSNIARQALGDVAQNRALANASLDRALALEPQLADLWWIRFWGTALETVPFTVRARAFERALAADPDEAEAMFPLAFVYLRLGRRAEALELYERARLSEPLWPTALYIDASYSYGFRRDRRRALELIEQILAIDRNDSRALHLRASIAFSEGHALDWDRWTARAIAASPRNGPQHGYLSKDYAHLGIVDAALHHARIGAAIGSESGGATYTLAHAYLFTGNIEAAREVVNRAVQARKDDFLVQLARGELQYFSGDCAGAIQYTGQGRPAYAQPPGAIDLMTDPENVAIYTWCLRSVGDKARVEELNKVFHLQFQPPTMPGAYDGLKARMAAAVGDRKGLLTHLRVLEQTRSMDFAFVRHEPMIQEYLPDPEIRKLLDTLEARSAEWRKIIPKSSMRVPIPGITPGTAAD